MAKKYNGVEIVAIVIAVILAIAAVVALNGWIIMLLFGALASIFEWSVTLSYGEAIIVSIALSVFASFFKSSKS